MLTFGKDLRTERLMDRKQELRRLLARACAPLKYTEYIEGCGTASFQRVCELDLEGIVAKQKFGPYVTEREQSTWFKILNREYSQKDGREELFERERHQEPVAGWHSSKANESRTSVYGKAKMPVTNVVEAVLGRKQVKWDALWRLFAWLLDAQEGHALGSKVVDEFCRYSLGTTFESFKLRREYQLGVVKDGKGKWPDVALAIPSFQAPTHIVIMDDIDLRSPGSRHKLGNLTSYRRLAREQFPLAIVRAIVLTNAYDGSSMLKVYDGLGSETLD
ncbi:MAG: hypothetical protein DMG96_32485, partial [Acidobacteria bacterium]